MKYKFPQINSIDDVLPAILGHDEFIVAEKDGYKVVNYVLSSNETFPPVTDTNSAILRECRGLIFSTDGKVIARRLHKFFNVGEKEETFLDKIDLSQPHVILQKLDGSMITPIPTKAGIRWGTKMGMTEASMNAEEFAANHAEYDRIAQIMSATGFTPIFEWVSRKNRIVIDYPTDQLVLVAIRDNKLGTYVCYSDLVNIGKTYGIPVVQQYPGTFESMQSLMDHTKSLEGEEGYVIRFDDGHMLKIKGEWYLKLHKTKEFLSRERYLVDIILSNGIDDLKSFMLPEDLKRVVQYEIDFMAALNSFIKSLEDVMSEIREGEMTRKDFALGISQGMNSHTRAMIFSLWDAKKYQDARSVVINTVKKNLSKTAKFDDIKVLIFPKVKWSEVDDYGQDA